MSNAKQCRGILEQYIKARIPFISVRTSERARILNILSDIADKVKVPIYVHTLSQGMRELISGRAVNEDRSVMGAIDYISTQIMQKQNLTFILTEVCDIEDDTQVSRQFLDLAMLGAERGGAVIVVTDKPIWGTLQRLGMTITLDPPNEDEMYEIIKDCIEPYTGHIPIEWGTDEEREASAVLAGVSQIEAENVIATLVANGSIKKSDLNEVRHAKDRIFADISGIERIQLSGQELNVGGLAGLKQWLEYERPLLTADLRDRGIRPPRGVLLVGVPGCGKSLSAKAIAASWNLPLYRLDLSTIHGQYLGQSEGRLKEALATADHVAPCVLWIDEIEKGLAGAVGGGDGGTSTRLVGQFLFWLQEAKARVFVVATANNVSQLPPELLRRGRFDELFFVDLPTPEERKEIINIYIKRGLKKQIDDSLMNELVNLSDGFAGSDLESAVRDVVKHAYLKGDDSVTPELFKLSFQNVVPLSKTSPEQIESIRTWGRERAISASGMQIGEVAASPKGRRMVIV